MDTKLTLKLDKNVINKAKKYAASNKRSLSRIIESYLKSLLNEESKNSNDDIKISQFVKSISTNVKLSPDLNYKKEYSNYLSEKYK